jgi:hypothetical protein
MRDKDDRLMEEALEQMQEGIFDRMGARKAGREAVRAGGGKTGIGGMIQKGKQAAIKGLGGQVTSADRKQASADNIAQSKGQVNALTASYMNKIQKIAQQYGNDIAKLGVDVSMIEDAQAREIVKAILAYNSANAGA